MSVVDGTMLQVTSEYSFPESSAIQNVFHFLVDATYPTGEALVEVACETALGDFFDPLLAYLSDTISTMSMTVDEIQFSAGTGRWEVIRQIGDDVVGAFVPTNVEHVLPPGVAGLMQLTPIYRRHRGYKYIAGFTEAMSDADGTPSTVAIQALGAALTVLLVTEWTIETGIASMYYVIPVRNAELWNVPTAGVVRNKWSYQRRRKAGVGL